MPRIALPYHFYFLYLEPLFALLGGIQAFATPSILLVGTSPSSLEPLASAPPTPLTILLITNMGSLYLMFAWNQAVVLRVARELKVWRALVVGMLISDVGHGFACYAADPVAFWDVLGWGWMTWVTEGTLVVGVLLRLAFLMGVGVRR